MMVTVMIMMILSDDNDGDGDDGDDYLTFLPDTVEHRWCRTEM